MLKIFIGYDPRQQVSYNVLQSSIIKSASVPVSITPLIIEQLPLQRRGLTPFTYTRFLVPYLCDFEGWALFLDADILVNHDISELFDLKDDKYSVIVRKGEKKFEWASVMLFNNAKNKILTPEYIESAEAIHTINWVQDEEIGDIPGEWNFLVGYDEPRHDVKLLHYTQGVPYWPETQYCDYGYLWKDEVQALTSALPWSHLMGTSVHAVDCNGYKLPKYLFDLQKQAPKPNYVEAVETFLGIRHDYI